MFPFSFFKKLFHFLYWVFWDLKNPREKYPFGLWIFVGLYGEGKTLSMVEYLERARIEFPNVKIATNFEYKHRDYKIQSIDDIINLSSPNGVIFAIDEFQQSFYSKEWASLDLDFLRLLTQNRKEHKQIICTSQDFELVIKDIRRLFYYIIEVKNFAGRWVWQRAFRGRDFNLGVDGVYNRRQRAWRYNFVASNDLFALYDTYETLQGIKRRFSAAKKGSEA